MKRSGTLSTIAWAGLIAGILDITSAFVIAELKGMGSIRMLQGIASGLLGPPSFEGGMGTAGLGIDTYFLLAVFVTTSFLPGLPHFCFRSLHPNCGGVAFLR